MTDTCVPAERRSVEMDAARRLDDRNALLNNIAAILARDRMEL